MLLKHTRLVQMRQLKPILLLFVVLCLAACRQASVSESPIPITEGTSTHIAEKAASEPYEQTRQIMVEDTIAARGISDQDVLESMRTVPRHEFVPEEYLEFAYADDPLPIGYGQTISQPYIVAWMTELLELEPGDKVLEIGTGSGYQAAVLAELDGVEVYSIEIVPELAELSANRLAGMGYTNVQTKQGDGYYGWPKYAPFDAIIVTAAPDHLPPPLVDQLAEDGKIVIPIGPPGSIQTLWKFQFENGELKGYNLGLVRFVPLTGERNP